MAGLSAEQRDAFERDGFLAIEQLLHEADLVAVHDEYEDVLDAEIERLADAGVMPSKPTGSFDERYAALLAASPDAHRAFNISLPLVNGSVDAAGYRMHCGPAVFDLLRHPLILDAVESLIGPEISASPVQQMRMKPPEESVADDMLKAHSNVGPTTWHQDTVALLPDADDTELVTVWLALTDAFEENGCLVSVPGSHRLGQQIHCVNDVLASEPNVPLSVLAGMPRRALPVRRGGAVLFHKHNVHCSLPNRSGRLRWSMDLRYNPTGQGSGRPAFPGFVARRASRPGSALGDVEAWRALWDEARRRIVSGEHHGRVFEDSRWKDPAVC